jgi:hypothetical protein
MQRVPARRIRHAGVILQTGFSGPSFGFGAPQLTSDNPRTMDVGLQINF